MRKLLIAVALLLGVVFIITKLAEVQAIADTLRKGDWRFILMSLGVQAAWLVNVAAMWRAIYRELGMEEKIGQMVVLTAAANFLNVVAPSAGMGGIVVFISDARRRGFSPGKVTVSGVLFVLFDYAAFSVVLALGLFVLFRRNNLTAAELGASGILVLIAAGLATLIVLGMRSADSLGRVLRGLARMVNRLLRPIIKRDYLSEHRAQFFAIEAAEGLHELRKKPENLLTPLALALSSKALLISVLFLMFLSFQVPFTVGTLIAGWAIGYLFLIVSPTPAGLGFVEGALALALTSLRVPLGAAAVLTLAYRGITFWIPLLFGMFAFRWLSRKEKAQAPK
jgi:glycosyltransferase 2 family protein